MLRTGMAAVRRPALGRTRWRSSRPATPPPLLISQAKSRPLTRRQHVYARGQGGNFTVAVAKDGIIMVDAIRPLHDKIKAAIATVSNQPIKYLI